MTGSAISRFTNPADYAENLRELGAVITWTEPGPFTANLIRIELLLSKVIDTRESVARVGYLSIPPGWSYAFFVIHPDMLFVWNEETLPFGDILLAGEGERLCQRTVAATHFGAIGIRSETLHRYAEGLAGQPSAIPAGTRVIRPQTGPLRRLLQLHARIVRTIQTRPGAAVHPETVRAIEQELIEALVICLVNGESRPPSPKSQRV